MKSVVAGLIGLSLAPVLAATATAQPMMKSGEVLVLDVIDNAPGGAPGNGLYLFRADRGSRKGTARAGVVVAQGAGRALTAPCRASGSNITS